VTARAIDRLATSGRQLQAGRQSVYEQTSGKPKISATQIKEETMPESVKLHPQIDGGVKPTDPGFGGGVLVCLCQSRPVKVRIKG
jgi:hypothetical protein